MERAPIRNRNREIRKVRVGDLRTNPANHRLHPDGQRAALDGILQEVGFVGTFLAFELPDGSLRLLDGHLRKDALADDEVEVCIVDCTPEERKKILATHDGIGALAQIDHQALEALMQQAQVESPALQAMLADMAERSLDGPEDEGAPLGDGGGSIREIAEDEVPDAPETPVTRTGDVWILGEHRLLCGDSTKAEDVARVMNGERAALCFTSPPYAQQREYTAESRAHTSDWDGLMRGVFGNLPMADDGQVLVNLGLVHRDGEWLPYWDGWIEWMRSQGWRRFGWYVWDQGPGMPGDWSGRFAPSHEFVFHFNRESRKPEKARECKHAGERHGGKGQRGADGEVKPRSHGNAAVQPTAILDSVIRVNRQGASHDAGGHPAPYPVGLAGAMLASWPGSCYEPFSGSGTTIIAAEQLGCRCFAIEIAPQYVDIAVQRWQKLAGRDAVLESTGQSFSQVSHAALNQAA